MRRSTKLCTALTAGAMAIVPVAAQAAGSKGKSGTVVVDWRASSNTATIASRSGTLQAVHTKSPAKVGAVVQKHKVRHLVNGTVAADLSQVGRTRHARIRGTVVAVVGKTLAISAPGTTFMVKIGRSGKRSHEAASGATQPVVGSTVMANVNITANGGLVSTDVTQVAAPNPQATVEIEGTISVVDVPGRKITVHTSDDGISADFVVSIGDPAIAMTSYTVGQEVEVRVVKNADGTFTLMASSQNGDDDEADDEHRCRTDRRGGQYDSRGGGFGRGDRGKGGGNGGSGRGGRGNGGGDDN